MNAERIAAQFAFEGNVIECKPFGSGHINDTYRVTARTAEGAEHRYILQAMNRSIFPDPASVMENVFGVTRWLRERILDAGGDPDRETLTIIKTKDGRLFLETADGEAWRAYRFIEDATSYDRVESEQDFYESAVAFGHFQHMLAEYPAHTLHEVLPGFHNTVKRYAAFEEAVRKNPVNRLIEAFPEVVYLQEHKYISSILQERLEDGRLPLRVTHNDTKLNNIMIDNATHKAICVIDLDTVMPGLNAMDFGDAIRFGASTAAEDESDLSKVHFDLHLFEVYAKGFLEGCGGFLTEEEKKMLPYGALVITYEQALRFLADYILGDPYYKIDRPDQNLVRARTQIRLAEEMEAHLDEMTAIVENA